MDITWRHLNRLHSVTPQTYPFVHEALGQQAMDFEESVLVNGAVVAAPCEGGQVSQEVSCCPSWENRGAGARPADWPSKLPAPLARGELKSAGQLALGLEALGP